MTAHIIDGNALSRQLRTAVAQRATALQARRVAPGRAGATPCSPGSREAKESLFYYRFVIPANAETQGIQQTGPRPTPG